MAHKALRRGKLHGQYRALSNHWNRGRNVPWLNVSGLWLEDAGFNVGDPIEIIVGKGKLVIKKAYDVNSSHWTAANVIAGAFPLYRHLRLPTLMIGYNCI